MTKTNPRRVLTAQRRQTAVTMRIAGATFDAIGGALGITRQATHALVVGELDALAQETAEGVEHLRELELRRLDHLLGALWPAAMAGNTQAVNSCLKIGERRARLCGLDGPVKVEQEQNFRVLIPDEWPVSEAETKAALERAHALQSGVSEN